MAPKIYPAAIWDVQASREDTAIKRSVFCQEQRLFPAISRTQTALSPCLPNRPRHCFSSTMRYAIFDQRDLTVVDIGPSPRFVPSTGPERITVINPQDWLDSHHQRPCSQCRGCRPRRGRRRNGLQEGTVGQLHRATTCQLHPQVRRSPDARCGQDRAAGNLLFRDSCRDCQLLYHLYRGHLPVLRGPCRDCTRWEHSHRKWLIWHREETTVWGLCRHMIV